MTEKHFWKRKILKGELKWLPFGSRFDFQTHCIGIRQGNNVYRMELNHPKVQDMTQHWVHREGFFYLPFGYQNYYVDHYKNSEGVSSNKGAYFYYGNQQPFSLWGY